MRGLFLAAVAAILPLPLLAQQGPAGASSSTADDATFDRLVAREAVGALADRLEADFVFPDKGRAYAAMLRTNLAAGKYDRFASQRAFADAVTNDLQAINKDGHLRVHVVPPEARRGPEAEAGGAQGAGPAPNTITKSGWLADGVAHIAFDGFLGTPPTMAALAKFIADHKGARALIIDIRAHRGGGLDEMDLLLPHIFAKPTTLVAMDTRASVAEREGASAAQARLRRVTAPEGVVRHEHYVVPAADGAFHNTRVYLLISKRSASAAEHFALALKQTGRAVLVGETTMGAGHFGGMAPLDKAFTYAAFIPHGRTFDPATGIGWEGTGVAPDVPTPAAEALTVALRLAGAPDKR